jgi:hypothetical protein
MLTYAKHIRLVMELVPQHPGVTSPPFAQFCHDSSFMLKPQKHSSAHFSDESPDQRDEIHIL